jgi:hypothetical protein
MSGAIPPLLQYAFMAWCSVKKKKKHRDNFTTAATCPWKWTRKLVVVSNKVKTCYVGPGPGPCHHRMACPGVVDGGDGLIWRVAANILNKHSRIPDKWWSLGLGLGRGTKNRKMSSLLLNAIQRPGIGRILWNYKNNGKLMSYLEHGIVGVFIGQVQENSTRKT